MIRRFFSRLGCLLWFLLYLTAGFFAGRWAFLSSPTTLLALQIAAGFLVGIIVIAILLVITFLVLVATDKDYDNPSPFHIKPLPKGKRPTPDQVDRSGVV